MSVIRNGEKILDSTDKSVKYVPQTLTDSEKSQVLENLGITTTDCEIITNSNGTAYKFRSGLLINAKIITITPTFSAWGSVYETNGVDIGLWAMAFKSRPVVQATITYEGGGYSGIVGGISYTTSGQCGALWIMRGTNPPTGVTFDVSVIGIGQWK